MAETTVRVDVFEILKQKSNNATKNIIILSAGEKFVNMSNLGVTGRLTTISTKPTED